MNISGFCIRHPVATILMSAALICAGLFSYSFLPLAALPRTESGKLQRFVLRRSAEQQPQRG